MSNTADNKNGTSIYKTVIRDMYTFDALIPVGESEDLDTEIKLGEKLVDILTGEGMDTQIFVEILKSKTKDHDDFSIDALIEKWESVWQKEVGEQIPTTDEFPG